MRGQAKGRISLPRMEAKIITSSTSIEGFEIVTFLKKYVKDISQIEFNLKHCFYTDKG